MNEQKPNPFSLRLEPAQLQWRNNNPFSEAFDDHFFAQEGGYEESQYVFLGQNGLPERWQNEDSFSIGETGFGTGLNFLTTVESWLTHTRPKQRLHYFSVEKHPFKKSDLTQIYQHWPKLAELGSQLLDQYPPLFAGFHRRYLFNNRVVLTLAFGDVEQVLPQLTGVMDAWYLDGFAPSKNPDMWTQALFDQMAQHSHGQTTFSTFTAAGFVRRGLQQAGFEVAKFPGFGHKREMLFGRLQQATPQVKRKPWFAIPKKTVANNKKVLLIGGGIAGTLTAKAFNDRGWETLLVDANDQVATAASGNPAGLVAPHWSSSILRWNNFTTSALFYAFSVYSQHADTVFQSSGMLQLLTEDEKDAFTDQELKGFLEFLDLDQTRELANVSLSCQSAILSQAGYLKPREFCQSIVRDENINTRFGIRIEKMERLQDEWIVYDGQGREVDRADVVVICNAFDARKLLPEHRLHINKVRGQLSFLYDSNALKALALPVCHGGYILPQVDGFNVIGATFQHDDEDTSVRRSDHEENCQKINDLIEGELDYQKIEGRTAFRTTTIDRVPVVGPVYDKVFYNECYQDIRHGKPAKQYPDAEYENGLFLNVAHGSRGLTTAPITAEMIVDYVEGTPQCVPRDNLEGAHTARFLIRSLKRGLTS